MIFHGECEVAAKNGDTARSVRNDGCGAESAVAVAVVIVHRDLNVDVVSVDVAYFPKRLPLSHSSNAS